MPTDDVATALTRNVSRPFASLLWLVNGSYRSQRAPDAQSRKATSKESRWNYRGIHTGVMMSRCARRKVDLVCFHSRGSTSAGRRGMLIVPLVAFAT